MVCSRQEVAKTNHRSNPSRKIGLNMQKSVLPIVPNELTERMGEERGRRLSFM